MCYLPPPGRVRRFVWCWGVDFGVEDVEESPVESVEVVKSSACNCGCYSDISIFRVLEIQEEFQIRVESSHLNMESFDGRPDMMFTLFSS